jgi:hypothetical protein
MQIILLSLVILTHLVDLILSNFYEILSKANLPDHLYPKLIIGNHDDREILKKFS